LRKTYAEAAKKRVEDNFTIEIIEERLKKLYSI